MKTSLRIEHQNDYENVYFDDLVKGTKYNLASLMNMSGQTTGIAVSPEDQAVASPIKTATPKQVALINNLMREAGVNFPDRFLSKYRVTRVEDMTQTQLDHIITTLKTMRTEARAAVAATTSPTAPPAFPEAVVEEYIPAMVDNFVA